MLKEPPMSDDVPLLKHLELHVQRLEEAIALSDKSTRDRFCAQEKTTKLLADALEKRLDGMNEFRLALTDQASEFASRADLDTLHNLIEADLRILREARSKLEGAASQADVGKAMRYAVIGAVAASFGILIGVGNILLRMAGK
jgi:hypothetical protein